MKPKDMDIDEILKRHLPRATPEEVDEASERVCKRIRGVRFSDATEEPKAQPEAKPESVWLPKFDFAVLTAVDEFQGAGNLVRISLRVAELLEEKIVSGAAVYFILGLMERSGLVTSSSPDPNDPDSLRNRLFQITASGPESRGAARAA